MNIDISKIVSDKIADMHQSNTIKEKIEESIEKTILSSIKSVLVTYGFTTAINNKKMNP